MLSASASVPLSSQAQARAPSALLRCIIDRELLRQWDHQGKWVSGGVGAALSAEITCNQRDKLSCLVRLTNKWAVHSFARHRAPASSITHCPVLLMPASSLSSTIGAFSRYIGDILITFTTPASLSLRSSAATATGIRMPFSAVMRGTLKLRQPPLHHRIKDESKDNYHSCKWFAHRHSTFLPIKMDDKFLAHCNFVACNKLMSLHLNCNAKLCVCFLIIWAFHLRQHLIFQAAARRAVKQISATVLSRSQSQCNWIMPIIFRHSGCVKPLHSKNLFFCSISNLSSQVRCPIARNWRDLTWKVGCLHEFKKLNNMRRTYSRDFVAFYFYCSNSSLLCLQQF